MWLLLSPPPRLQLAAQCARRWDKRGGPRLPTKATPVALTRALIGASPVVTQGLGAAAFWKRSPSSLFLSPALFFDRKLGCTGDEALKTSRGGQIILGYELPCSWDRWTAAAEVNNKRVDSACADCRRAGMQEAAPRRVKRGADPRAPPPPEEPFLTTHDSTGRVRKMPPYSTPPPQNIPAHKREEKITECDFHQNPPQCGISRLFGGAQWLAGSHCVFLMAYLSSAALRRPDVFVRLQGVPEIQARPRGGLPGIWTAVKSGWKKRLRRGERRRLWVWHSCLDHTDHRGPSHENIPLLSVFIKCHLTLGEALAVCPLPTHSGGMRTCSGFGQLAEPISTLAGSIGDFMAVCPPWCFFLSPHLGRQNYYYVVV